MSAMPKAKIASASIDWRGLGGWRRVGRLVGICHHPGHWLDRAENKTSNVIYHISDKHLSIEEWAEK
jgi:hypothetical protein